jgi:hypothetical protein
VGSVGHRATKHLRETARDRREKTNNHNVKVAGKTDRGEHPTRDTTW